MLIFLNTKKRPADFYPRSSSAQTAPDTTEPSSKDPLESDPADRSIKSKATRKAVSAEIGPSGQGFDVKEKDITKEVDKSPESLTDIAKMNIPSNSDDHSNPKSNGTGQDQTNEPPDVDDGKSDSSPQHTGDALKSTGTRSSSINPTQAETLIVPHPFANDIPGKLEDQEHPEIEVTHPSDDPTQRPSEDTIPTKSHQDKETISVPKESGPVDLLAQAPDQNADESKSNGAKVSTDVLPSEDLSPRSYRHHHAVRRARIVVLRRAVLKVLLGRQLCETTKPALDLLASGQNLVPIDDEAMADMIDVPPIPVTPSKV